MKWLRRLRRPPPPPIEEALWQSQWARLAGHERLSCAQAARWRELSAHFLSSKAITAAADCTLEAADRLLIAMLCCEPILDLGPEWLQGWHEVIVYPGRFGVRRSHLDEDSGVLHEWDDELAGECWEQGPLILSLEDAIQAAEAPQHGYHVVVHEIAHKLDLRDGHLDGVPPLPDPAWRKSWIDDFQRAFEQLQHCLEAGQESAIDPYAAEAPDEFFAVVSEYHFTAPELLAATWPSVAGHLARFYHGQPRQRAARA